MTKPRINPEAGANQFLLEIEIAGIVDNNIRDPNINIFNMSRRGAVDTACSLVAGLGGKGITNVNGVARTAVNLALNGNSVDLVFLNNTSSAAILPKFDCEPQLTPLRIINKVLEGLATCLTTRESVMGSGKDKARSLVMGIYDDIDKLLATGTGDLINCVGSFLGLAHQKPGELRYQHMVDIIRDHYWGAADTSVAKDVVEKPSDPAFVTTTTLARDVREEFDVFVAGMDHVLDAVGLLAAERRTVRVRLIHEWLVRNGYVPEVHDTLLQLLDKTEGK